MNFSIIKNNQVRIITFLYIFCFMSEMAYVIVKILYFHQLFHQLEYLFIISTIVFVTKYILVLILPRKGNFGGPLYYSAIGVYGVFFVTQQILNHRVSLPMLAVFVGCLLLSGTFFILKKFSDSLSQMTPTEVVIQICKFINEKFNKFIIFIETSYWFILVNIMGIFVLDFVFWSIVRFCSNVLNWGFKYSVLIVFALFEIIGTLLLLRLIKHGIYFRILAWIGILISPFAIAILFEIHFTPHKAPAKQPFETPLKKCSVNFI